jgi:PAS domain S-box-containing protein
VQTSYPDPLPDGTIPADLLQALLDHLPQVPFFTKDTALRYVSANGAMIDLCGVRTRAELLGKTARDFFPEATRRRYEAYDRQVMRTRTPIRDQLDLCVRRRGPPIWILFSRWPIIQAQQVVGVAAIARELDAPDRRHPIYQRLADTVEFIHANIGAQVDISVLAERAGVSVSQLERDFVGLFGVTPRRYMTKVRVEAALELLKAGGPIVSVAHACGFADQSAFTRRFRATVGMSPSEYRRMHLTGA